ncbi:MAG: leucine-rich repeat protein [Lachnospiraceae bacterium]|nr:leucine-rich repeat protein [Lachnospiraceae bacterium]
MEKMKRVLLLISCFVVMFSFSKDVEAAKLKSGDSGVCGTNVVWTYIDDETVAMPGLYISGTGMMYDYDKGKAPWYMYRNELKNIIICEGVENIGKNAFYNMKSMQGICIGESVVSIDKTSFKGCSESLIIYVSDENSYAMTYAIENDYLHAVDATVSGSLSLKKGSIVNKGNLKYKITDTKKKTVSVIGYCTEQEQIVIPSVIKIGKKSYTVNAIGNKAFYQCTKLKKVEISSTIKKIGKQAFYGCNKLKFITIKSKELVAKNVGKQAFKGTHSKLKVKVPKSKKKEYKKVLKNKGMSSKAKVI